MLIGSIVFGIICFFLNSYYTGKQLGYSSLMQLKDVAPSYILAFLVAFPIYFFKYLPISNWVILPIQIVFGATLFFIICNVIKMDEYIELKAIFTSYYNKLRKK